METTKKLNVFILEDDFIERDKITKILEEERADYKVRFFSKSESIFDLLNFYPDLIIADFNTKSVINWKDWF